VDKFLDNSLDLHKKRLLENIKFLQFIDIVNSNKSDEESWDEIFIRAKEFREINNRFPIFKRKDNESEESKLGHWLIMQRQKNKKGMLTPEQIKELTKLGFEWRDASELNAEIWERTFQGLKSYYSQNQSWPTFKEGNLGKWCAAQRTWYKGQTKNNSDYPKERKEKLDSIGFPWELRDESWDDKFQKVKEYFTANNTNFLPTSIDGKTNVLYTWLVNQKVSFKKGKLEIEKIEKLKEVGIDFEDGVMVKRSRKSWDENFIELKNQIEKGTFKSISEDGKISNIYNWLNNQIAKYKAGNLEQDKVEKLKSLGVIE